MKIPVSKRICENGTKLDLVEVCRVAFCNTYQVYRNDSIPAEDVLLAMFGLDKNGKK